MRTLLAAALFALLVSAGFRAAADDKSEKLVEDAAKAFKDRDFKKAAELAAKAVEGDPKNADAPYILGLARLSLRENDAAAVALKKAVELDPKNAAAIDRLGDALLKSGQFKESVAAFDTFLEMKPKFAADHWRRGIALYYAGKFADGTKQFDLHRTVNPEDVENSAWHYLCNARATSPKQARKDLIPVSKDARVPMKQVLQLFAGDLKPQDVIDAAENSGLKGNELTSARFYAHLYVALYYESEKDAAKVKEHLTTAVEKYKIGDYMWDVGKAHLDLLNKKK